MDNTTDYKGMDYGMGSTNIDTENNIRFACISQNTVFLVKGNKTRKLFTRGF